MCTHQIKDCDYKDDGCQFMVCINYLQVKLLYVHVIFFTGQYKGAY